MATKVLSLLAASIAFGAITFFGAELAVAKPGAGYSGGHAGGHFGGAAHFSGAHFTGAHFGGARFSGARISGAPFRGYRLSGTHFHGFRFSGTHFRGSHLSSALLRSSRIGAAHTLGSHTAWNHWTHHHGHGGWGGWGGSIYWPYFYGDLFAFAFWPYGYFDPFWIYGDSFVWDAMFWPGPDYAYGGGYDVYGDYAYGGPRRTRSARSGGADRDITGSTGNADDLAQSCGGVAPGVTDLPFDYIEQAIKPAGEQLKALAALKTASSQASDALKASCSGEVMYTPLGRLDAVQKRLDGMIAAVGIVRTPLDNFYNSLGEEQRQRFMTLRDARTNRRGSASGNDLAALCSRRAENFAQLPVERVEQIVKPTEQQRDAFARLKIVTTEAANRLQASCPTQTPQTPIDRFDALAKRLNAMAEAIKIVRPELASFYASLTDEQKARFNTLRAPQTPPPRQG